MVITWGNGIQEEFEIKKKNKKKKVVLTGIRS